MERRRSRISPLKWVIHLPRCNEETEEIERDALNKAPDKEGKKGVREKYVKVNGKASKKVLRKYITRVVLCSECLDLCFPG